MYVVWLLTLPCYVYSLCVFYYSVLSCVADVADCPLQRLSAIVIKNIIIYYYYHIVLCGYRFAEVRGIGGVRRRRVVSGIL